MLVCDIQTNTITFNSYLLTVIQQVVNAAYYILLFLMSPITVLSTLVSNVEEVQFLGGDALVADSVNLDNG
jgi:hypothetical protein